MTITAERYHDISCGHRVFGHESKCAFLHGHNYRVHFTVAAKQRGQVVNGETRDGDGLDDLGRVLDFSVIKSALCFWLEKHWDHKFLIWDQDPLAKPLALLDNTVVWTPFNPTAENLAKYLVEVVAPAQLADTQCQVISCRIEETRKCSATFLLPSS